MDLIGKDQLLKIYSIHPQAAHETYCLRKFDVAIVIAMNQQYRGFHLFNEPIGEEARRIPIRSEVSGGNRKPGTLTLQLWNPWKSTAASKVIEIPRKTNGGK